MAPTPYAGHGVFLPYLVNKAATLLNLKLQKVLDPMGLTLTHWRVLAFLSSQDGLTLGALAEATMTEQSTLSRSMRVLEEHGYAHRRSSAVDSRAVEVFLDAKGRRAFDEILAKALDAEAEILHGVSHAEADAMRATLLRIIANCQA